MARWSHSFFWLFLLTVVALALGLGLYRVTTLGKAEVTKAVAASQDRILFARKQVSPAGIFTVNIDGTAETVLFTEKERANLGIGSFTLKFSPDGKFIAFLTGGPPGEGPWDPTRQALWVMNPDGSGRKTLVVGDQSSWPYAAAWSPGSDWIAYSKVPSLGQKKRTELWLVKPDGSQSQFITDDPRFSPVYPGSMWWLDANRIAWEGGLPGGGRALFALDLGSRNISTLAEGVAQYEAILSPDGKKIALETGKSPAVVKSPSVQVIELSGGGAKWSGDGSKVLYNAWKGLWLLDVATGRNELLVETTTGPAMAEALSPDGKLALFSTRRGLEMLDIQTKRTWVVASLPDAPNPIMWFLQWVPGR